MRAAWTSEKMSAEDIELTPLTSDHAAATAGWMTDPAVTSGLGLTRETSPDYTKAWIDAAQADPSIAAFAIMSAGRHVGNVVLDRIDPWLDICRLYIFVGAPDARGKGVGEAAVRLAADYAFEALELFKVWLTVHAQNTVAIRAYERCGFAVEGVLRGEFLLEGQRIDAVRMSLLATDREVR